MGKRGNGGGGGGGCHNELMPDDSQKAVPINQEHVSEKWRRASGAATRSQRQLILAESTSTDAR